MILFIDTTNREQTRLALVGERVRIKKIVAPAKLSERLLAGLISFFKAQRITLGDIKKIAVVTGPGSFVGIRTGLSLANALGYASKIPLLGLKLTEVPPDLKKIKTFKYKKGTVTAHYGAKPNITKPKSS